MYYKHKECSYLDDDIMDICEYYERSYIEPLDNRTKQLTIKAKSFSKAENKAKRKLLLLDNEIIKHEIIKDISSENRYMVIRFWIAKTSK